ncbi:MAG: L,D-transpeptidase family protein [Acidimicrobiales bacterium]
MSTYRARRQNNALLAAIVAVVVVVTAGVVAIVVLHKPTSSSANGGGGSNTTSTSGSGHGIVTEAVSSTSPTAGETGVSPAGPIQVHLTQPLGAGSPMPTISPRAPGSWALTSSTTLTFEPSASLIPFRVYTVTVPGGPDGIRASSGDHLGSTVRFGFKVAAGSFLRLQQLLAGLGYLPVSFSPASATPIPASQEAITQLGSFNWRWQNQPAPLTTLFVQGEDDVLTQGAVMMFESLHGLATDGIAGPEVWSALLQATAAHQRDPNPWDWVYVQKTPLPEMVFAYSNGKVVFQTQANTGAVGFATPDGSWPVYLHWATATMTGKNPDGTTYDDKGVLWVSYFHGGDALHAFLREGYGFPQSLGCVEMPTAAAAALWPLTPVGTVVTIQ